MFTTSRARTVSGSTSVGSSTARRSSSERADPSADSIASGTSSADHSAYLGSDKLARGKRLSVNQYLRSKDGRYALVQQSDGNLVIYGPGYHATWSARTSGHPGAFGYLQPDGNLVVYPAGGGKALWNTGMARGVANLSMQGDGNLVKYSSSNAPLWQTHTRGRI